MQDQCEQQILVLRFNPINLNPAYKVLTKDQSWKKRNIDWIQSSWPIQSCFLIFANHLVKSVVLKPLTPPFQKWYYPNAHCEYHIGIPDHSIEDCTLFNYKVQGLVRSGALNFDKLGVTGVFLLDWMRIWCSFELLFCFQRKRIFWDNEVNFLIGSCPKF